MSVHELATPKAANIDSLKDMIPDFAKDIRLNLSSVLKQDPNAGLSLEQVHGTALAAAYATRNRAIIDAVTGEVAQTLTPEEANAAKAAATIMAMNNIYYRSTYMTQDEEIGKMPAGLRMNVIGNPGIDKATFELYSLAVSAINGCSACIVSHSNAVQHGGLPKAAVQQAFKIAAVLNAAAQALEI
ncbi:MAG: alkyl hydroperoxide reductase [Alphaproteobacteria bacterium]|nr:alkyl hydroperoxide reductase [Alphaproteobacteria bacterium]